MGMTDNQLKLVSAVAANDLVTAKGYAIACCNEDATQKNRWYVDKYRKILLNSEKKLQELPYDIQGFAFLEDFSETYNENRYFLSERESEAYRKIHDLYKVSQWLEEKHIPYHNTVLLYGESGAGKTEFSKYIAYKLGLPYLYVNLSQMVDSYLGNTAKNIGKLFSFVRQQPCVLMLDEIDAVASKRVYSTDGAGSEIARSTTCLIQMLDSIQSNHIIIGATNIPDKIDPAIKRRFSEYHEVVKLTPEENFRFICQYMDDVGIPYDKESAKTYAVKGFVQAKILDHIVSSIVEMRIQGKEQVVF